MNTKNLHIAINKTKLEFIARGPFMELAEYVAKQFPNPEDPAVHIACADDNRTYSALTFDELKRLYENTTGAPPPGGDYNALANACRELGEAIAPIATRNTPTLTPKQPSTMPTGTVPTASPKEPKKRPVKERSDAPLTTPTRPKEGSVTGRIWELADSLLGTRPIDDIPTIRAALIDQCAIQGIKKSTAQAQYARWKKHREGTE